MASQMGDPLAAHAAARPDKAALIHEERTVTFAELHERSNRYAAAMRKLGVNEGDRITGMSFNSIEGMESAHGVRRIGAVGVPINYHLRPAEVAYIVNDSGAKVVTAWPTAAKSLSSSALSIPISVSRLDRLIVHALLVSLSASPSIGPARAIAACEGASPLHATKAAQASPRLA